jgi:hypothetical protein
MPILVWNSTDRAIHLQSFDGDSVMVGPKAKGVKCAQKFNWNVPAGIKIQDFGPDTTDPTQFVKGNMPIMSRKPPKAHNLKGELNTKTATEIRSIAEQKKRARDAAALLKTMNNEVKDAQK